MKRKINFFLLLTAAFVSVNIHCMDKQQEEFQARIDLLKQQAEASKAKTDYHTAQSQREEIKISPQKAVTDAAIQTSIQIAGKNVEKVIDATIDRLTGAHQEKQQKEKELHTSTQEAKISEKKLTDGRFINEQIDAAIKSHNNGAINKQERDKRLKAYMAELDTINGKTYSEEPKVDTNIPTPDTNIIPTPGKIKQIAALIAAAPSAITDGVANILPINDCLNHLANKESFKGGLLDTYKLGLGRAAALGLIAGATAIMYKTYAWYTNEDRLLAQETVVELEEQQLEIATQFKKEMEKSTLSDDEKTKLLKAYENYMDELQDEINEQKVVAGYGVAPKLAFGALVATTGITGLTVLAKHYLSKSASASTTPELIQSNLEEQNPVVSIEIQTPSASEPKEQTLINTLNAVGIDSDSKALTLIGGGTIALGFLAYQILVGGNA